MYNIISERKKILNIMNLLILKINHLANKSSVIQLINHFSYTSISSIVNFINVIIIALIYPKEDLAYWGSFIIMAPIILVLNLSFFSELILVEKSKKKCLEFYFILFIISIFLTFIYLLIFYFLIDYSNFKIFYINVYEKITYFILLFLFVFSFIFKNLYSHLMLRFKKIKKIGFANILRAFSFLFMTCFFYYINFDFNKIIISFILSELIIFSYSVFIIDKKFYMFSKINFNNLYYSYLKTKNHIGWGVFANLFNSIAYFLIFDFIIESFSKIEAGIYTVLNRTLVAPFLLISKIIGDIYSSQTGKSIRKGLNTSNTFNNFFKLLLTLCILISIIGFIIFPFLYKYFSNFIYFDEYILYFKPILIYSVFFLLVSPLSRLLTITKNFKKDFIWQSILLITMIVLTRLHYLDFKDFLYTYAYSFAALYILYIFIIRSCLKK